MYGKPYVFPDDQGTDSCGLLRQELELFVVCQKQKPPAMQRLILKVFRNRKQLLVYFLTYDCCIWCLALEIKGK